MKNISLCILLTLTLIACGGGSGSGGSSSENINWVKRSPGGFEAIVDGSFTLSDMQEEFGDYCRRNGKLHRSLRMIPDENGQKRVIGDCL